MAITRATNLAGLGTVFDALTDGGGLSISGISTFTDLNVTRANVTGVSTFATLNITNTNPTQLNVTGVTTTTTLVSTAASITTGGLVAGIATVNNINSTHLNIAGLGTFSSGPVLIGTVSSTGTASQPLQVTGGAYISDNLGIGFTTPVSKLNVDSGHITVRSFQNTVGASGTMISGIIEYDTNSTYGVSIGATVEDSVTNKYGMWFTTHPAYNIGQKERIRLTGDGNLGIGITNPQNKLSVSAAANEGIDIAATGGDDTVSHFNIYKRSSDNFVHGAITYRKDTTGSNHYMNFVVDGSERARFTGGGNLGIGTTSVSNKIAVVGSIESSGGLLLTPGSSSTPSVRRIDDTNTGLYFPSADQIALSAGGSEVLLSSGGNIRFNSAQAIFINSFAFTMNNTWQTLTSWSTVNNRAGGGSFLVMINNHTGVTGGKRGLYHCYINYDGTLATLYTISTQFTLSLQVSSGNLQAQGFDGGTGLPTTGQICFIFADNRMHIT